jgi:phosphoribosylformimino-5-aminoimidazole carboxamide ribotide isomerase
MIIYPAIDLINGQCVRLHKGDFEQQTTYDASPIETAQDHKKQGAEWLHLVDLDGARNPAKRQTTLISDIIQKSNLKVQTGGGVRSIHDVETLLSAGASRIVIGSLSVKNPDLTKEIFQTFGPEKICLATDVIPQNKEYMIAVSGWQEESTTTLNELIETYLDVGLKHILCTDISRDGTMEGSNVNLYETLQNDFPHINVQASGGVNSLDDIRNLNTAGVIIGKALYEGAFTVKDALEAAC